MLDPSPQLIEELSQRRMRYRMFSHTILESPGSQNMCFKEKISSNLLLSLKQIVQPISIFYLLEAR